MEGNLVIVESPSKAKTIQKFLGKDFTVMSSYGHIRDLQDKKLSIDVAGGFEPEYVIPASKKKVVAELKAAAQKAGTVWLASDEDREGEAISWHLSETLGLDPATTHRIAFHEITREAIQNAIINPRGIDMDMVCAQQARRVMDRLVGFELSPILWRKIKSGLSAGRVQSVALRLIVDREREITAFRSESYYQVEALFDFDGVIVKGTLDTKFSDIAQARAFLEAVCSETFIVSSVERKEGVRNPAAPFTTSTLQQEAGRKLHFPVALTMRLAQSLYERGFITYMRTDSTNLSTLALGTAKSFIQDNFGEEYSKTRQYKTSAKGAQEAHEAIRPTFVSNTDIDGTAQEKKLYSLIWKRTLASQMASARVMNTTIEVKGSSRQEKFVIHASEILFDGFLKLYMEGSDDASENDEEVILPEVRTGMQILCKTVTASCKFTQPPLRYSEPALVKKLEELAIGRPSTYATIISTLTTSRGYVVKADKEGRSEKVVNLVLEKGQISQIGKEEKIGAEKGKLIPADIGMIVCDYLVRNFPDIMDYGFTAGVEKDFDLIADGQLPWKSAIANFYNPFHVKVDEAISDREFNHVEREIGVDPEDGEKLIAKFGQFGPYVQKGEGENKVCASLGRGQLIENITLEDAVKLFRLPRTVGEYKGLDVIACKGRFGPYLKYDGRNISLPRSLNPEKATLEECVSVIEADASTVAKGGVIAGYPDSDIVIVDGRYGPYIKHAGANFKIPRGKDAAGLTEEECKEIISSQDSTSPKRKFKAYRKKQ